MSQTAPVDVGTPSPAFAAETEAWSHAEVRFHGFAELPAVKGWCIRSPEFTCAGRRWRLALYPGGRNSSDDGMVGLIIQTSPRERLKIYHSFEVKNNDGERLIKSSSAALESNCGDYAGWGFINFQKRSAMLGHLVEGTLVLDVKLKLAEPTNGLSSPFIGANPFLSTMLNLFNDEESADISFEVGGQGGRRSARKKAKTSMANETFYAHRFILQNCASQLADICGSGGKDAPVPVIDVKPEIFGHLLYHIYGGKVPEDGMEAHAKEIIDAADRYGVPSLKLEAEAYYVKTTAIDFDNLMENLQYADSKNCALLKEVVMDFMVENQVEVLQKLSFDEAPSGPTIMRDIFAAMARGKAKSGSDNGGSDRYDTMSISNLRRKAHERGLNVDGSRETLIASLKEDS